MFKKKLMWVIPLIVIIIVITSILLIQKQSSPQKTYVKATYLPLYRDWDAETIRGNDLTHIYLAFATLQPDFTVTLSGREDLIQQIDSLHNLFPHLKINISIGGWGIDGFSDLASTKASREIFIQSVLDLVDTYHLDGVDIDWEYPTKSPDGVIKARPEDSDNFTLLMQELRTALDDHSPNPNTHYELSFAAPLGDWALKAFNVSHVIDLVDYIHLMGYDYIGSWSPVTGHHTNWLDSKLSPTHLGTYEGIKNYLSVCPPEKLILGIPAYGHGWSGVEPHNNGLFQSAKQGLSPNEMDLSYTTIKHTYTPENGFTYYWDDDAKASYLYNGDIWITYEDPHSIAYKAQQIKDLGLAGMMYWEYTQDAEGDLLDAITEALKD